MKKPYVSRVDVFVVIFLLISILIANLALAGNKPPEIRTDSFLSKYDIEIRSTNNDSTI